jgi:hypothetical protein
VKRTVKKRLTLELERVKMLVVELSPAELRSVGAGFHPTNQSTTTTQNFPSEAPTGIHC